MISEVGFHERVIHGYERVINQILLLRVVYVELIVNNQGSIQAVFGLVKQTKAAQLFLYVQKEIDRRLRPAQIAIVLHCNVHVSVIRLRDRLNHVGIGRDEIREQAVESVFGRQMLSDEDLLLEGFYGVDVSLLVFGVDREAIVAVGQVQAVFVLGK